MPAYVRPHQIPRYLVPGTSDDPLERLGLIHADVSSLKIVCCVFSAYHAVKAQISSDSLHAPIDTETSLQHGPALRQAWSVSAQTFENEAGERAVQTRSFSLVKFIAFVANSGGTH